MCFLSSGGQKSEIQVSAESLVALRASVSQASPSFWDALGSRAFPGLWLCHPTPASAFTWPSPCGSAPTLPSPHRPGIGLRATLTPF